MIQFPLLSQHRLTRLCIDLSDSSEWPGQKSDTLPSLEEPARRKDTLPPRSPAKTRGEPVSQHSDVISWPRCSQDMLTFSGRPRLSSWSSHTTTRPWLNDHTTTHKQTTTVTGVLRVRILVEMVGVLGGARCLSSMKCFHGVASLAHLVATAMKSSSLGQHAT